MTDILNDPQKGTFTMAIGTIIVIIFMFLVAIRPALSSVFAQIANNKIRQNIINDQTTKEETLANLISLQSQYVTELDLLRSSLPEDNDIEYLLANVDAYDNASEQVKVTGYTISYKTDKAYFQEMSELTNFEKAQITFNFEGNRETGIALVDFLENFPRPINVLSVNIGRNTSSFVPNDITGSVSATVYYRKEVSEEQIPETEATPTVSGSPTTLDQI